MVLLEHTQNFKEKVLIYGRIIRFTKETNLGRKMTGNDPLLDVVDLWASWVERAWNYNNWNEYFLSTGLEDTLFKCPTGPMWSFSTAGDDRYQK